MSIYMYFLYIYVYIHLPSQHKVNFKWSLTGLTSEFS